MGHYAKVNAIGIVEDVIVAESNYIDSLPDASSWLQTSYNTRGGVYYIPDTNVPHPDQSKAFRKNYAGISYRYDPILDAFYEQQPFASWTLNQQTCYWEPPFPAPDDGKPYKWDETTLSWIKII